MSDNIASGESRAQDFQRDVALLIDWENLKWGLSVHKRAPNVSSIIDAAEAFGRLVAARAYADWTHPLLAVDAPNLYRVGIEPIYAQGRHQVDGTPLKNSADVRLAVDAVFLCSQLPHIGTYVFVTGDGDLIHPVNFIRMNGHRVVVIAVSDALSDMLSSAADSVLLYDRDIEPAAPSPMASHRRGADAERMNEILRALPDIVAERPDRYPFNVLGNILKSRYGFVARELGITFKEFMLRAEAEGIVSITTIGNMDYALLPTLELLSYDEDEPVQSASAVGGVSLGNLSPDQQDDLYTFLHNLQASSSHLTVNFIVSKLIARNVLPSLSEEQAKQLILSLLAVGALRVAREVPVENEATGVRYVRREIALDPSFADMISVERPHGSSQWAS